MENAKVKGDGIGTLNLGIVKVKWYLCHSKFSSYKSAGKRKREAINMQGKPCGRLASKLDLHHLLL
jgi:hypothetical protein